MNVSIGPGSVGHVDPRLEARAARNDALAQLIVRAHADGRKLHAGMDPERERWAWYVLSAHSCRLRESVGDDIGRLLQAAFTAGEIYLYPHKDRGETVALIAVL